MKIGIMTWFLYHNYGTALQVTALSETIKSLGHEPTVINYDPDSSIAVKERENSLGFFVSVKLKLLKRLRRTKIFGVLRSIKHFIMPPMNNNSSYLSDEKREENFNAFLASNISLTDECNTMQQLESTAYKFDTVVCGSDQIWSPLCFDTHYFLDFVHKRTQENTREHKRTQKDIKKVAYAPSIDMNHVRNNYVRKQIIRLAGDFDFISLREKEPAEILSQWLNKRVSTVLDPSLLLNAHEWEKHMAFSDNGTDNKYCVIYMLGQNEEYWREIYRISDELGLVPKIIPVYTKDLERKGCIKNHAGPAEFLRIFKEASFVCTDSFHGMLFSIIFHVNFITFQRFTSNDPRNQNFRIFNIARLLSLENRIYDGNNSAYIMKSAINFHEVDAKLKLLRENSLNWLKTALNSTKIR